MKKIHLFVFLMATLLLTACGIGNTNTTYQRTDIGVQGKIEQGTIESIYAVNVAGTNEVGTLSGAVAGGAAGSMIGGNTAVNVIGAVGGAVVGGMIGSKTEKALTADTAYNFMVRTTAGTLISVVQSNELGLRVGDKVYLNTVAGTTRIVGIQRP